MEDTAVSSRPGTPALVYSPSTARSSFSQPPSRPHPSRQVSWGKRHASLDSARERPTMPSPALCGPPPPDPPHIHTPPSSPEATPYAYPFLPSFEPRGDARPSVTVDVHPDQYVLACRMPHFDHSSITVATRRGRLLVIAADRWDTLEPAPLSLDPALIPNPPQPAHFERRITFGWDADMARIRAEFDGVTPTRGRLAAWMISALCPILSPRSKCWTAIFILHTWNSISTSIAIISPNRSPNLDRSLSSIEPSVRFGPVVGREPPIMPHAHPSQHSYLNYILVDVIRVACWNGVLEWRDGMDGTWGGRLSAFKK
ncbi:unnamed protein product [Rhizoctonia solani]|uniref:Uncharacterized protein n=1 Tax=Rhizoctonia solani TaxID=456999 RepID=A0A8H3D7D9_9AGAM|nr:unnamed protein product [Rhizoctonia solani]